MRKIKKGDSVVVIAGRDKGKRGDVASYVDDTHVIVNGIVTKEVPIHISNVAIWNPVTQKPDRIGFKLMNDGRKLRFFKSNGEQING
jgi:large subunit ribosomal protein L24